MCFKGFFWSCAEFEFFLGLLTMLRLRQTVSGFQPSSNPRRTWVKSETQTKAWEKQIVSNTGAAGKAAREEQRLGSGPSKYENILQQLGIRNFDTNQQILHLALIWGCDWDCLTQTLTKPIENIECSFKTKITVCNSLHLCWLTK